MNCVLLSRKWNVLELQRRVRFTRWELGTLFRDLRILSFISSLHISRRMICFA